MITKKIFEPPKTIDEAGALLAAHMPEGRAWNKKNISSSGMRKLINGLSSIFWDVQQKIFNLVEEFDINLTTDLLPEWETSVGIPDICIAQGDDLVTRRERVIEILRKLPIVTLQEYQDFVDQFFPDTRVVVIPGEIGKNYNPSAITAINYKFVLFADVIGSVDSFEYDFEMTFTGSVYNTLLICVLRKIIPGNVAIEVRNVDDYPCFENILSWYRGFNTGSEKFDSYVTGDLSAKGYAATFDGFIYLDAPHLAGTETVSDSSGTSTPSVSAGKIEFTAGWCGFVELDNGDYFVLQSSVGSQQLRVYNVTNQDHGTLVGASRPVFTTLVDDSYFVDNGYSFIGSGNYVPSLSDWTADALGRTIDYQKDTWNTQKQEKVGVTFAGATIYPIIIYDPHFDSDMGAWIDSVGFPEIAYIFPNQYVVGVSGETVGDIYDSINIFPKEVSSIAIKEGTLLIGTKADGVYWKNYADGTSGWYTTASTPAIISDIVNDVAVSVLSTALTDGATGLKIPCLACGCENSGVTLINGPAGTGTAVDITWTTYNDATSIKIINDEIHIIHGENPAYEGIVYHVFDIPSSDITEGAGNLKGTSDAFYASYEYVAFDGDMYLWNAIQNKIIGDRVKFTDVEYGAVSLNEGVAILDLDSTSPANGMVHMVTNEYFTGFQVGDSVLSTLSSIQVGDIGTDITTEHVLNGTFASGVDDWSLVGGANASITAPSGQFIVDVGSIAGTTTLGYQNITVEAGQVYQLTYDYIPGTSGQRQLRINDNGSPASGNIVDINTAEAAPLTETFNIKSTTTTIGINFGPGTTTANHTALFDNITLKKIQNLVSNGEFSSDRDWTKGTGWSISGGVASCDGTQTADTDLEQTINFEDGGNYLVTATVTRSAGAYSILAYGDDYFSSPVTAATSSASVSVNFKIDTSGGAATDFLLKLRGDSSFVGTFDNVAIYKLEEPDRSVKRNNLQINGQLTRSVVNSGCELVAYSGWANLGNFNSNCLSIPEFSLGVGTGDFSFMLWVDASGSVGSAAPVFEIGTSAFGAGGIRLEYNNDLTVRTRILGSGQTAYDSLVAGWNLVEGGRESGQLYLKINGVESVSRVAAAANTNITGSWLTIGGDSRLADRTSSGGAVFPHPLCQLRFSKTIPSSEQSIKIYNLEKEFFVSNTRGAVQDASNVLLWLSYSDTTGEYLASGKDSNTYFKGLISKSARPPVITSVLFGYTFNGVSIFTSQSSGILRKFIDDPTEAVYYNAPDVAELKNNDVGIEFLYDSTGTAKDFTQYQMSVWTGGTLNNKYFWKNSGELLIYSEELEGDCLATTLSYIGV